MSEELKAFYKAYSAWIDAGAINNGVFSRSAGLCFALFKWAEHNGYRVPGLYKELKMQFITAGLSPEYPFNLTGINYRLETEDGTIYRNPARIAWVRKHATD